MKRLALLVLLLIIPFAVFGKIRVDGKMYYIESKTNLKGQKLTLPAGSTLVFIGKGSLKNAILIGNETSVVVSNDSLPVFRNVIFEGTWTGKISDLYFNYTLQDDHTTIVENLFKFDDVTFTRGEYYIKTWKTIYLNPRDMVINGNGVKLYLPKNKDEIVKSDWGGKYKVSALFSSHSVEGASLYVKDLNIIDVFLDTPIIYQYFYPYHTNVVFENVNSEGCGGLLGMYNTEHNMDQVMIKNCSVKTSQFAIELANRTHNNKKGTNKVVHIEGCNIHRTSNALFVGPISLVGDDNLLKKAEIINNNFYESVAGNIELSGVVSAIFEGNSCTNLFCYSGIIIPKTYSILNNIFTLQKPEDRVNQASSLKFAGESIVFRGNQIHVKSAPFPFIQLLFPEKCSSLSMTNNVFDYSPDSNDASNHSYLLSIPNISGKFEMMENEFITKYDRPAFSNNLPSKYKTFKDPFKGKINNHNK